MVRPPGPHDGRHLWALAGATGLDVNSPYAYVLWGDHHRDTSLVALEGPTVVGFVIGFRIPAAPREVFVWQIAVAPEARRRSLGSTLLDELVARTGVEVVEATVTPSNHPSMRLFRSLATRHGGRVTVTGGYEASMFPDGHEEELRVRVDLRTVDRKGPQGPARGESYLGDL